MHIGGDQLSLCAPADIRVMTWLRVLISYIRKLCYAHRLPPAIFRVCKVNKFYCRRQSRSRAVKPTIVSTLWSIIPIVHIISLYSGWVNRKSSWVKPKSNKVIPSQSWMVPSQYQVKIPKVPSQSQIIPKVPKSFQSFQSDHHGQDIRYEDGRGYDHSLDWSQALPSASR